MRCGSKILEKGQKTFVMGVLNITPNSFSDGGDFLDVKQALLQAEKFIAEGADIIDVGGVSTAPYRGFVSEDEEIKRVIPVIEALFQAGIDNISIDTMRAKVASLALDAGASWINDQHAGLDEEMPKVMKRAQAVVIMHDGKAAGVEAGEQVIYSNVVQDVGEFFKARIASLKAQGVDENKIIVDPGVGFGKGLDDSLAIINNMDKFHGAMTLIGLSRKSFIGKITGISNPKERDYASLGAQAAAIFSGVNIIRTHNVRACVEMAQVLDLLIKKREVFNR